MAQDSEQTGSRDYIRIKPRYFASVEIPKEEKTLLDRLKTRVPGLTMKRKKELDLSIVYALQATHFAAMERAYRMMEDYAKRQGLTVTYFE